MRDAFRVFPATLQPESMITRWMDRRWENYKLMRAKRHQGHDAYD